MTGRDLNYPDQVAAIFAAGMIATAWFACRAGAGGTHLDISQRELTSFLVGEVFAAGAEAAAPRNGNAQAPHLLQECFLAADDRWIAVTIEGAVTPALARLLDVPCSTTCDELHRRLRAWSAARAAEVCVQVLTGAGVAAALVHDGCTLLSHRGSLWGFALVPGADGGFLKGFPFQLTASPLAIRRDAPAIGNDTADVLVRIGGYSAEDVAALARAGIIELAPS